MSYKPYSQTTSGWAISTDSEAEPAKRWKAIHPLFGEKFFVEHDEILEFTVSHMRDQFIKLLQK